MTSGGGDLPAAGATHRRAGRRRALALLGGLLLAPVAGAHTPYRQWVIYRKKHLLIGTTKSDPESYALGKSLTARLEVSLPESKARVARAPNPARLASLAVTGQLQLMVLRPSVARQLREGEAPFQDLGPIDLKLVFADRTHVLVATPDLPAHHAWLITNGLLGMGLEGPELIAQGLPLHAGTASYLDGDAMPGVTE